MTSGLDPGELGIYGFRNRTSHDYSSMAVADSGAVHADRLWDHFSRAGRHVVVVGVPQTSPPVEVNGELVSCFLTPDTRTHPYTHPPELRAEIESLVGTYRVDVRDFRSEDRDRILAQVYEMTEQRFSVCRHLLDTRPWEFFMMVEIGLDRMHHAFWRFFDERHPRHEPGHRYGEAIRSYYAYLDEEIGELLERFDERGHRDRRLRPRRAADAGRDLCQPVADGRGLPGARAAARGIAAGAPGVRRGAAVDWDRTRAWGEGGYYCRLSVNLAGREPRGASRRTSTRGCWASSPSAWRRSPAPTARSSARACSAPPSCGASSAGSRRTWSCTSATSAGAATAASVTAATGPSRTTPAPTTPTTTATASA